MKGSLTAEEIHKLLTYDAKLAAQKAQLTRVRTWLRAVGLTVVLVLGVNVAVASATDAGSPPVGQPVTFSSAPLSATIQVLTPPANWGASIDISGIFSVCSDKIPPYPDGNGNFICDGGTAPNPNVADVSGQTVQLQQAPYPYTVFSTVAQTTTDGGGFYEFSFDASFTSKYRVTIPALSLTSAPSSALLVSPSFVNITYNNWGNGILNDSFMMLVPRTANFAGLRVSWYARNSSQKRWYLAGFSKMEKVSAGVFKASIKAPLPRAVSSRKNGRWDACFTMPSSVSMDDPAHIRKCPTAKSVPLSALGKID